MVNHNFSFDKQMTALENYKSALNTIAENSATFAISQRSLDLIKAFVILVEDKIAALKEMIDIER